MEVEELKQIKEKLLNLSLNDLRNKEIREELLILLSALNDLIKIIRIDKNEKM